MKGRSSWRMTVPLGPRMVVPSTPAKDWLFCLRCKSSANVISPSRLTMTSMAGHSLSAFSSQKVTCEPPIMVVALGWISLAVSRMRFAWLYRSVVAVTPTTSGLNWFMRWRNASMVSFSAWQSITLTSCPACCATALRYAMPRGMNGGCACACSG